MKGNLVFLRKPLKPILYAFIYCVLFSVALIFALQYELDKIAIQETVDNYYYVGTIYDRYIDTPYMRELPEELVRRIADSKYIAAAENRRTVSGRSDRTNAILDYFMTEDTIDLYGMIEGQVYYTFYDEDAQKEYATLYVQRNWAGILIGQNQVQLEIWHDADYDPNDGGQILHDNDRVLITGRFEFDRELNGMNFASMQIRNPAIKCPMNVLDDNPIIFIPEELDRVGTEEFVQTELEKRGMLDEMEKIRACRNTFTVRPVSDMNMLMSFADYTTYICAGRGIVPSDKGTKVCVVDQFMANKSGIKPGDHINLALSDTSFTCKTTTHDATWQSGFPKVDDEFPEYGELEDYEVIGIFNFYHRRNVEEDFFKFSRNDIFIPVAEDEVPDYSNAIPCTFSFRLDGPDYEDFMDEFEIELYDSGYNISVIDTGWDDFKDSYNSMMSRKLVSLISAIMTLIAATLLSVILISRHFKYEFGLRRLLGASLFEASGAYFAGYLVIGIPALLVSLGIACQVYDKWLAVRMAKVIESGLPDTAGCIEMLGKWVGCSFAAGLILMLFASIINGRKNLLGMIR